MMKKIISRDDFKYMRFLILLAFSGICFLFRSELSQFGQSLENRFLSYYEEALGVNRTSSDLSSPDEVSSGDGLFKEQEESTNTGESDTVMQQEESECAGSQTWEFSTGDENCFDDALFIGDSRTVGLQQYAGLDNATFYCATGLSVHKVFSSPIVTVEGSNKKITIEEALTGQTFGKIYLMLGINEMGTGDVESFIKKYGEVLERLQELQPDAIIYLESIMKVSSERSAQGDYINNEGIEARNAEIEKLADQKKVFYLDINPCVCDDSGALDAAYTFDGVHLKASYITLWKQYLFEHIVKYNV